MTARPAPTAYSHKRPSALLSLVRGLLWVTRPLPWLGARLALRLYLTPNLGFRKHRPFPLLSRISSEWPLTVGGKKIMAYRWGDGPAVLLVHGWESGMSHFSALIPALLSRGFSAVAFDAPGHGKSPGRQTHLLEITALIREAAEGVENGFYGMIGHSFGGMAILYAAVHGVKAERVITLSTPESFRGLFDKFCLSLRIGGKQKQAFWRRVIRLFQEEGRDMDADFSALANLPKLTCPALIIHDLDDAVIPVREAENLAAANPRAQFFRSRGLGHNRLMNDPAVVALCADFLARPA